MGFIVHKDDFKLANSIDRWNVVRMVLVQLIYMMETYL